MINLWCTVCAVCTYTTDNWPHRCGEHAEKSTEDLHYSLPVFVVCRSLLQFVAFTCLPACCSQCWWWCYANVSFLCNLIRSSKVRTVFSLLLHCWHWNGGHLLLLLWAANCTTDQQLSSSHVNVAMKRDYEKEKRSALFIAMAMTAVC